MTFTGNVRKQYAITFQAAGSRISRRMPTGRGEGQRQPRNARAGARKYPIVRRASHNTATRNGSPTVSSDSAENTMPSRASANAGTAMIAPTSR